jgi:hypothetical protein
MLSAGCSHSAQAPTSSVGPTTPAAATTATAAPQTAAAPAVAAQLASLPAAWWCVPNREPPSICMPEHEECEKLWERMSTVLDPLTGDPLRRVGLPVSECAPSASVYCFAMTLRNGRATARCSVDVASCRMMHDHVALNPREGTATSECAFQSLHEVAPVEPAPAWWCAVGTTSPISICARDAEICRKRRDVLFDAKPRDCAPSASAVCFVDNLSVSSPVPHLECAADAAGCRALHEEPVLRASSPALTECTEWH